MHRLCALLIVLPLAGCLLPTPFSVATMGADAVSYAVSGKTVTDHGLSLALGGDCALVRVIEGEICAEARDYPEAANAEALTPLPETLAGAQFAGAHPEVLAATARGLRHDGRIADGQGAAAPLAYLSDGARPSGIAGHSAPFADAIFIADATLAPTWGESGG